MNEILLLNAAVIQVNNMVALGAVPVVAALTVYQAYNLKLATLIAVINK